MKREQKLKETERNVDAVIGTIVHPAKQSDAQALLPLLRVHNSISTQGAGGRQIGFDKAHYPIA